MKTTIDFCTECMEETEHIIYSELDEFRYKGIDIPFEDRGLICCRCGNQSSNAEEIEDILSEITDTYKDMIKYR